jgi:hypothetical protein
MNCIFFAQAFKAEILEDLKLTTVRRPRLDERNHILRHRFLVNLFHFLSNSLVRCATTPGRGLLAGRQDAGVGIRRQHRQAVGRRVGRLLSVHGQRLPSTDSLLRCDVRAKGVDIQIRLEVLS